MKHIVALLGSNRKRNTYRLLMQIQSILKTHEIDLTIVELYRQTITPCLGCENCILHGKCVLKDDTESIMKQLLDADGIILASPVYLQQISGQMKSFFDRTCVWYHRPALTGKPILSVATTKGSGLQKTLAYLESIAIQWGAIPAGTVGRSIFTQDKPVSEKEISAFVKLIEQPQSHSPSLNQLINFEVQKALALSLNALDRAYWEEKRWLNQPYFSSYKFRPLYRSISHTFGQFLQHKMRDSSPTS